MSPVKDWKDHCSQVHFVSFDIDWNTISAGLHSQPDSNEGVQQQCISCSCVARQAAFSRLHSDSYRIAQNISRF